MKIIIGTTNKAKIKAVFDAIKESPYFLNEVKIKWIQSDSWVSEQPRSLKETLKWAKWRIQSLIHSWAKADFYIGLEWWVCLMHDTAFLFWFAAISDWKNTHTANSSMIPLPKSFKEELFQKNANLWDISRELSWDSEITHKWWTYWELTEWMITRDMAFKQSIHCAFAPFFNKHYK